MSDVDLESLSKMTREERIAIYNRADSDHKKVVPTEYPAGVNWPEVHRKIQQGNARAKRQEKA